MNIKLTPQSTALLVPTLNAGSRWTEWINALQAQTFQPSRVLVIDSSSTDKTITLALNAGFDVVPIERSEFNHGGTRRQGVGLLDPRVEFVVFMTQDAILTNRDALANLLTAFQDDMTGATYGRQLPSLDANALAYHARLFNYPDNPRTVRLTSRDTLGIKACFMSNSFAAYRVSDLRAVGGFPENVILGEDTAVAARLLLAGKAIRYQSDACVYHSHNYASLEEFRRYFDTGVFHARERWLLEAFGGASGEGLRFVRSELRYLIREAPWLIPSALLRTVLKLAGYRLGRAEDRLPLKLKRHLSMFRNYWK